MSCLHGDNSCLESESAEWIRGWKSSNPSYPVESRVRSLCLQYWTEKEIFQWIFLIGIFAKQWGLSVGGRGASAAAGT